MFFKDFMCTVYKILIDECLKNNFLHFLMIIKTFLNECFEVCVCMSSVSSLVHVLSIKCTQGKTKGLWALGPVVMTRQGD